MSRFIDEILDEFKDINYVYNDSSKFDTLKRMLIDAVEVVHCKDCKWWDKVDNIDGVNYGTCERKCTAIRQDAFPNENWFCADGERKNDGNNC